VNPPFPLSREDVDVYQRDGYVLPKFRLEGESLETLQRLTRKLVSDNPGVSGFRRPHLNDSGHVQSGEQHLGWLKIASLPRLVDAVEQLIGPDIILFTTTLFYKPPLEAATRWHRDGHCYPINPLATTTAWISVFDMTNKNAALRVIPGSHMCKRLEIDRASEEDGRLSLSEAEERAAIDVELQAGEMILFDVSTVHGSWPNRSFAPRAGYAIRFFPSTSHYDRSRANGLFRHQHLFLVRGLDRAGNILDGPLEIDNIIGGSAPLQNFDGQALTC